MVGERPIRCQCDTRSNFQNYASMHEGQFGTLLPKTVFNITEKGRTLLGMADGILEHTTDAEKLITYLDK